MSHCTAQQSWSAVRVNVFISTLASRIQASIYCFGGNAFWCPSKSLSETCAVGRPAIVRGYHKWLQSARGWQGSPGARVCWSIAYWILSLALRRPGPYLNGFEEITHPVRNYYISFSEIDHLSPSLLWVYGWHCPLLSWCTLTQSDHLLDINPNRKFNLLIWDELQFSWLTGQIFANYDRTDSTNKLKWTFLQCKTLW